MGEVFFSYFGDKLIKRWCVSRVKGNVFIRGRGMFKKSKLEFVLWKRRGIMTNSCSFLEHPERERKVRLVTEFIQLRKQKKLRRPEKRRKNTFTFVKEDCPGVQHVILFFLFPLPSEVGDWLLGTAH